MSEFGRSGSEFGRSGREWSETRESRFKRPVDAIDDGWDEAIRAADAVEGIPLDALYRTRKGVSRFEPNDIQQALTEPAIIQAYRAAPPAERAKMEAALTATLADARLLLTSPKTAGVVDNALAKLASGNDRFASAVTALREGIDVWAHHYDRIPKGLDHAATVLDVGTLLMTLSDYTEIPSASRDVSRMWFERALGESARKGVAATADHARRQLKTLTTLQDQTTVHDTQARDGRTRGIGIS